MYNNTRYLARQIFSRINYNKRAFLSTTCVRKNESSVQEQINYNTTIMRVHEKKPQRLPLVKNFFVGEVDKELLAYPEVVRDENLENLYKNTESYKSLLSDEIFNQSQDSLSKLKNYGSFGINVSENFQGRGYLCTETFYTNELEAQSPGVGNFLCNHRLVTQLIEEFGNEKQKEKFLPSLGRGDYTGSVGFFEVKEPRNKKTFNLEAKFKDTDNTWTLNGEKEFVVNPSNSSLFLVFASTESVDHIGDFKECITAFLIDGKTPGVKVLPADNTIGFDDVKQCRVVFENVVVPEATILGKIDSGYQIGLKMLKLSRMNAGTLSLSLSKDIINNFVNYCTTTKLQDSYLKDFDFIKERLGRMTAEVYALESMLYMTAGLIDTYENQDTDVESAMVKSYAIDVLSKTCTVPMQTIGQKCLKDGEDTERQFRDAAQLMTLGETLDAVKLYIGLSGLQHAGLAINEEVKKVRNPLVNPTFVFSKMFKSNPIDSPKQTMNLQFNLHPTCDAAAQFLEYSILRLQYGCEVLLERHGPQIIDNQIEILRLSEAATLCYAMFAAVARASRSYCIGLRHSEIEMYTASSFCLDGAERVKLIIHDIAKGEFLTNDNNFKKIAKQLINSKEYFAEHPITRNF